MAGCGALEPRDDGSGNFVPRFPAIANRIARWHCGLMEELRQDEYDEAANKAEHTTDPDLESAAAERTEGPQVSEPAERIHVFKGSTTNHDDWLHRGSALLDMDLYRACSSAKSAPAVEQNLLLPF